MLSFRLVPSFLLVLLSATPAVVAFAPRGHGYAGISLSAGGSVQCLSSSSSSSSLGMSQIPMQDDKSSMGETERLLLDAHQRRTLGLRQEYGVTIKMDGLDGVRAVIWTLFDVSNVVFACLGVALSMGLMLNVMGYGYYLDFDGSSDSFLVIDTLQHIAQEQQMSFEAAKLAQEAMEKTATLMY